MSEENKKPIDDSIFDSLILSKNNGTFKDPTPLFSDWNAFSYAIDEMVDRLKAEGKTITKICCPSGDTTFASALAYRLNIGLLVLNPYDGLIISGDYLTSEDSILIVGTALCGGSMYFSMYTLIEDMGATILGFAFLLEKVWHRGRYKLMDSTFRGLPLGVISLVKYGVTVGNFVRFDCSAHGLGIREFRVLSVRDDNIGVNWLDGPVPCEKLFPKTRIIEMSFDKKHWVKYRE